MVLILSILPIHVNSYDWCRLSFSLTLDQRHA